MLMLKSCTPCQWREGLSEAAVSMWSPRCSSCATHANGGMDKADFSIRNRRSAAVSWRPHRRPHDDTSRSGRHGRPEPSLLWGGRPLNLPRCSHKHSLLACPHPSSRALALRTHRRPAAVVTHDSIGRPEPSLLWAASRRQALLYLCTGSLLRRVLHLVWPIGARQRQGPADQFYVVGMHATALQRRASTRLGLQRELLREMAGRSRAVAWWTTIGPAGEGDLSCVAR